MKELFIFLFGMFIATFVWIIASSATDYANNERRLYSTVYQRSPPLGFDAGQEVRVRFTNESDVLSICGPGAYACFDANNERIVMPNPCYDEASGESEYRRIMCHELGHVNNWIHEVQPHLKPRKAVQA